MQRQAPKPDHDDCHLHDDYDDDHDHDNHYGVPWVDLAKS